MQKGKRNYNTHQKLKTRTYRRDAFTCQLRIHKDCSGDMSQDYWDWREKKITRRRLQITVDHIVPVSKGGKWELKNLQTACRLCNKKKGNKI